MSALTIKNEQMMKNYLQTANLHDKILLYFQPIVFAKNGKIAKYEILARLNNKDNSKVYLPCEFIFFEESEHYNKVSLVILKKAFEFVLLQPKVNISINISFGDICNPETNLFILTFLKSQKVSVCKRITFELLETNDGIDLVKIKSFFAEVLKYKSKTSLDDFGVGFSNFNRLLDFSFNYLKIDGKFIKNLNTDGDIDKNHDILESIILFCKNQKIKIIAEWVENQKLADLLSFNGIEYLQGFHFLKPMSQSYFDERGWSETL